MYKYYSDVSSHSTKDISSINHYHNFVVLKDHRSETIATVKTFTAQWN